jgi:hypothetical protein
MKTIYITPASEAVIPFLRELLSNPAWVSEIVVCDSEASGAHAQRAVPSFMCSAEELNDSLCEIETEFTGGKTEGLTPAQMKERHAV